MSEESYSVRCDARHGASYGIEYTYMVNRKKQPSAWWTSDDESVLMVFRTLEGAVAATMRIHHNNPQVVPAAEARAQLRKQRESIIAHELKHAEWMIGEMDNE